MVRDSSHAQTNALTRFFRIEGTPIALVFVLLIGVFILAAPTAFSGYRIYMSFMATVPPPMIVALGLTLVVVAGEIDLSFPSVIALASYVFSLLYQQYDLTFLAVAAAIGVGALMGLVNGLVITKLGMPSLIATSGDALCLGRICYRGVQWNFAGDPDNSRLRASRDRRRAELVCSRSSSFGRSALRS